MREFLFFLLFLLILGLAGESDRRDRELYAPVATDIRTAAIEHRDVSIE